MTGYSGTDTELYIPEYIKVGNEELLVSEILRYAFFNVETIDYIHIPETIAIIGYRAIRVNEIVFCETADKTEWESEWCYRGVVITNTYLGIHGYLNGFYYAAKKDENGEPFIVVTEYSTSLYVISSGIIISPLSVAICLITAAVPVPLLRAYLIPLSAI